jgi:HD-GYP domain-containing protein (c-di-GMP phosphodiesterase class II)
VRIEVEKIPVSQLKTGIRIQENVITDMGNVLFYKDKFISQREIEILKAFQIKSVTVESEKNNEKEIKSTKNENQQQQEVVKAPSSFYKQYEIMFNILKKSFESVISVQNIPIMDIRECLKGLTDHIHEYNILTFSPIRVNTEDYLYNNSIKVGLTSYLLATWRGFPTKDLIPIAMAGLFHDIGNMKIDDAILRKPSKLTTEELKEHTLIGYNILKTVAGLNEGIKLAALQHHEKEDGTGYPLGVKSDKIHIYAKVISVADIFHAMTSKRYHQERNSPYLVLEQLFNESFGKLDPVLVQTFINKATQFNNGTIVKLSDDSIGEIIFSDRDHPTRPWVNVKGNIINLTLDRSLYIKEVIEE